MAAPIADLEADGKSVPVLLRQYLKLGARAFLDLMWIRIFLTPWMA